MAGSRGLPGDAFEVTTEPPPIVTDLVPPSVVLVLYGMIARQPVGQLWLAGVLPGLHHVAHRAVARADHRVHRIAVVVEDAVVIARPQGVTLGASHDHGGEILRDVVAGNPAGEPFHRRRLRGQRCSRYRTP